jgi:ArsR family transcriptional regulator, arsenate/arsenite/antimonite-responsive transcriptional repressor / arsenate reductase (thioredoxin)
VSQLARSDRRVSELTEMVGEPQNLVSYHLRELREAGLVTSRRSSYDGRDVYYRADMDRCAELVCAVGAAVQPGLRLVVAPPPARRRGRTPRVLFLCTGNSARSQMAEALLEHRSGHTMQARSAGSHPKPLHPNAVRVMADRSIDISGQSPKHLRRYARSRFDLVVTLCDRVREVCPEFRNGLDAAHWSMPDPSCAGDDDGAAYPAFEQTADELEIRIGHLIAHLSAEGAPAHDQ